MGLNTVSPHRYLFLSVDRIDAVDARKSARGTRLVTGSEEAIVGGRGHTRLRAMPHMPIVQILRPGIRRGVGRTPRRERRRDRLLPRPQHRVPSERGVAPVARGRLRSRFVRFGVASVARARSRRLASVASCERNRPPAQPPAVSPRVAGVRRRAVYRSWRAGAVRLDIRPVARHFPPCRERPGVGA